MKLRGYIVLYLHKDSRGTERRGLLDSQNAKSIGESNGTCNGNWVPAGAYRIACVDLLDLNKVWCLLCTSHQSYEHYEEEAGHQAGFYVTLQGTKY